MKLTCVPPLPGIHPHIPLSKENSSVYAHCALLYRHPVSAFYERLVFMMLLEDARIPKALKSGRIVA